MGKTVFTDLTSGYDEENRQSKKHSPSPKAHLHKSDYLAHFSRETLCKPLERQGGTDFEG
ncbi:MAG TPA: hypothetical protein PK858_02365 [Saprospiraceae bacterium]|nr:hypothetical protein [Saprospiraceae bacterium]